MRNPVSGIARCLVTDGNSVLSYRYQMAPSGGCRRVVGVAKVELEPNVMGDWRASGPVQGKSQRPPPSFLSGDDELCTNRV